MYSFFGIIFYRCSRSKSEKQWWFKLEHYFCCSFTWVEIQSNWVVDHKAKCQHKQLLRISLYHWESFFQEKLGLVTSEHMYIVIKKTDIFQSFINVNLHLIQQLMTVISLHLSATQCCISYLPWCLCVAYCKEKALALNIWNVVAWSKVVGHSSHSDVGCVDFWPIASGAIPAKDQRDPPQHGTITLKDSWQQD